MPVIEERVEHHLHAALTVGSNVQERVDVMVVCAEAAQGAPDSSVAGRRFGSTVEILHFGLNSLDRVIRERAGVGMVVPRDSGRRS
jgi:hypothetical protein